MKNMCTAISTNVLLPSHMRRLCNFPPYNAEAAGEAEEGEEAGEGSDEVGGGNIVGRETDVMSREDGRCALDREEDTRQRNEALDAISVEVFQHERTEEMAYAIEEQGAKDGEHLIRIAKALSCCDERKYERKGYADAEKRLVATCQLIIYEPIEEFGDEEDTEEPDGSGESLPQEVLPFIACARHQEGGQGGENEGEDDGRQE